MRRLVCLLTLVAAPAAGLTIDWVGFADPANACGPRSGGCDSRVDYTRMGRLEIVNAPRADLLEAAAAEDPTGLDRSFGGREDGREGWQLGVAPSATIFLTGGDARSDAGYHDALRVGYAPDRGGSQVTPACAFPWPAADGADCGDVGRPAALGRHTGFVAPPIAPGTDLPE